jgi:hypothetical protein
MVFCFISTSVSSRAGPSSTDEPFVEATLPEPTDEVDLASPSVSIVRLPDDAAERWKAIYAELKFLAWLVQHHEAVCFIYPSLGVSITLSETIFTRDRHVANDSIRSGHDWRRGLELLVSHFRGEFLTAGFIREELKSWIIDAHTRHEVSHWIYWHHDLGAKELRRQIVQAGGWTPCVNRRLKLVRRAEISGNLRHLRPLLRVIRPRPKPYAKIDFASDVVEPFQLSSGKLVFRRSVNVWPLL